MSREYKMRDNFVILEDRDIVSLSSSEAEVIVIPANMKAGVLGGLDAYVYKCAGYDEMLGARKRIGKMSVGECAITDGYHLHQLRVIHAVTPAFMLKDSEMLLARCYENALALARQNRLRSIAFPLLASGNMGFPWTVAEEVAREVLNREEYDYFDKIILIEKSLSHAIFDADYSRYSEEELKRIEAELEKAKKDPLYEAEPQFAEAFSQCESWKRDRNAYQKYRKEAEDYYKNHGIRNDGSFGPARFYGLLKKYTGEGKEYASPTKAEQALGLNNNLAKYTSTNEKRKNKTKTYNRDEAIKLGLALKMTLDDFITLIFSAGHSFPKEDRDFVILAHIQRGNYSEESIENEYNRLTEAEEKSKEKNRD